MLSLSLFLSVFVVYLSVPHSLSSYEHHSLITSISSLTRRGLRSIAFSYRDLVRLPTEAEELAAAGAVMGSAPEAGAAEKNQNEGGRPEGQPPANGEGSAPQWHEEKMAEEQSISEHSSGISSVHGDATTRSNTSAPAVLIGVVGIADPLRPESYRSVRLCQRAGIIVRMVTGDHLETARYIAKECGICTSDRHVAMTGKEFREMLETEPERAEDIIPRLRVLARSSPKDKETLVKWLKTHGQIVAATGDGTNDAPALKAADVGIAMFITGTAVCKSAADLWILDDNFASIVKSVMWGRCVFVNIRKFLQFQLTVNVVALFLSLIGAITHYPIPLTTIQLLWVNLLMDSAAAVALGTEKPDMELLKQKPKPPSVSFISVTMWINILGHSVYQLAVLLFLLYDAMAIFPELEAKGKQHYTLIFNTFVWMQLFNEFNARKIEGEMNIFEGIMTNPYFLIIVAVSGGVQAMMVELFGPFANTTHQTWQMWLLAIGFGCGSFPMGFVLRFIRPIIAKFFNLSDVNEEDPALKTAFEGAMLDDPRYSFKRLASRKGSKSNLELESKQTETHTYIYTTK